MFLLLVLLVAALAYYHPWRREAASGSGNPAGRGRYGGDIAQPVRVASATAGDMPQTVNALGTVTPLATVTVRTQIAGQLQQVAFTEGQMVAQGDFLAQIDPRPYQALLDQARGTLAHDQALLANARLDLVRYQKLSAQDSIAKQQVDTQASLVRQYEGSLITDQAQIDTQKLNIAYCHIIAPVAGRVGLRQVDAGNYVQTSDTNGVVVITQLDPISVVFTVPEDALASILPRIQAKASLPVIAKDRGDVRVLATGTLATVDNQIDTTTGTVKIRANFTNPAMALFPNQFVNVRLLVDTLHGALLVPNAAIQRGAPGTFVYKVRQDNTVTVQKVTIGANDDTNTAITDGLQPGDQVVIDGVDRLREGAKITIPPTTQGATAPAPGEATPRSYHRRQAADEGQAPPEGQPRNDQAPDGTPRHRRSQPQQSQ
jgi:multidrug efflux system membrane fusion protein